MIPIGDGHRLPIFPIAVYAIIALNLYVFFQEVNGPGEALISAFATVPYDITHGIQPTITPIPNVLTLITAQFLHGSILHIVFNMLFLFVFGPDIEYLCGHVRFVVLYLVCGVIGGLTQVFVDPASHVPSIGASGAIAGILGAYIVTYPTASVRTIIPIGCIPIFLRLPAVLVIGLWAASQFMHGFGAVSDRVMTEQGGGIAYFAHIGGFLAGLFVIAIVKIRDPAGRNFRYYY